MRIVPIKEALTRVGEQISGVHGTLTSVYKRRTGEGQYGPWSYQDGVIKDATGTIGVCFGNQEDLTKRKGMKVTITAKQGDKGLSGLLVEEDSYTDKKTNQTKTTVKLKTTAHAFIDFGTTPISGDDRASEINPDRSKPAPSTATEIPPDADDEEKAALEALQKAREAKAARLKAEAEAKAKENSEAKSDAKGPSSYPDAKRRIIQITNLYDYAMKSAKRVLRKNDLQLTDIYTATATVFIAMRDDNLTDSMPMALIEDEKPSVSDMYPPARPIDPAVQPDPEENVDQEPRTWQETIVTDGPFTGKPLGELNLTAISILFDTFKPKMDPQTGNYKMGDLFLKNALLCWKKEQP